MGERDEVLAGLLDGASHATCDSCASVMKRAYRLLAEAPQPSGCAPCEMGEPCERHDLLAEVDDYLETAYAGQSTHHSIPLIVKLRDALRAAEAPQPRVLWRGKTIAPDGSETSMVPIIARLRVERGTRVAVVIEDTEAPPLVSSEEHEYMSTACWHATLNGDEDDHERCRMACEYCAMPCRCACHYRGEEPPAVHGDTETPA